jgi:hypothetical protein
VYANYYKSDWENPTATEPPALEGGTGVDVNYVYELYKQMYPEYEGTKEEWIASLKGSDGRGIVKTEIIDGHLWITYSDDLENPIDLGKVTNPEYEGTEGLEFYLLPDGTYGVKAGLTKYLENIVIPSVYRGKAVTTIMENGFEAMRNLKTITIPNSITTIEKYAFNDCAVLETADIPNTVTSIGAYAFNNCSRLLKITIPSKLAVIEEYTFYGCKGAVRNTIIIPESVTKIKPHALEISKDIGIFFDEGSSWSVTCEYAYCTRDNVASKNIFSGYDYAPKIFTIAATTSTNYAEYFWGKQMTFNPPGNAYTWYLKSQECTWTKVQ